MSIMIFPLSFFFSMFLPIADPNDNTLTIKCRPDKKFDVPTADDLPECLAQCPAEKPVPPPENNIILDDMRTNKTHKLWEREELWYVDINYNY